MNNTRKYYFLDYLERKRKSAEHAQKRKRKEGMEKSVKIANNLKDKITPADIFTSFKNLVNPEDITAISPLGGNREFVVSFEHQHQANSLIGESITIKNNKYYILDANDNGQIFKVKAVIKIHWLPPGQDWKEIEELFNEVESLKIIEKERERYREESLKHIRNGVLVLKVEYELSAHEKVVRDILGIRQFDSGLARVQLSGHPPICSHCSGHHFERECKSARKNSYGAKAAKIAGTSEEELVVEEEMSEVEESIAKEQDNATKASTSKEEDRDEVNTVTDQLNAPTRKRQLEKNTSFTRLIQVAAAVSNSLNINFMNMKTVSPEMKPEMKKQKGYDPTKDPEIAQKFRRQQQVLQNRGIDADLELGMNDTQIEQMCGNQDTTKYEDLPNTEEL